MGSFDLETENKEQDSSDVKNTKTTVKRTWRHWVLGPVGTLYICGFAMQWITTHQYIYRRVQEEIFPNKTFTDGISYCADNVSDSDATAQKKTAEYQLVFSILSGVPAVIANVVFGSFTDKYGRKFLLILSISGKLATSSIFLIGSILKMDIKLFGIAYFIDGSTGLTFTFLVASFAFISDITTDKGRGIAVVLVEVCLGLGVSTASPVAGYILQAYGFVVPYILTVVCLVCSLLMTIFIIPESFPTEKRSSTETKCGYLLHSFEFYYASWNRGKRWKYAIVILVFSLYVIAITGREAIGTLYQLNVPFCWTPSKIGLYGALSSVSTQCFGFIAVKTLKRFTDDHSIAIVGVVSYGASCVLEGLAINDTMLYLVPVVGAGGSLLGAMMRSITSRMTSPQRQGAAAASLSVAETILNLFSGILANAVYGATVATYRGATFFVFAAICVLCITLLMIFKTGSGNTDNKVSGMENQDSIQVVSFSQNAKM